MHLNLQWHLERIYSVYKTIDPEVEGVHPLRLELDENDIHDIFVRVDQEDTSLTKEELDCAMDWLYDYIVAEQQNVFGTTVIQ